MVVPALADDIDSRANIRITTVGNSGSRRGMVLGGKILAEALLNYNPKGESGAAKDFWLRFNIRLSASGLA